MRLSHERLHVYQKSISFLSLSTRLLEDLPIGHSIIRDQLKRASLSIVLNIAEGAGKMSPGDQRRYYGIARGSALECGAALDVMRILGSSDDGMIAAGKGIVAEVAAMLTELAKG